MKGVALPQISLLLWLLAGVFSGSRSDSDAGFTPKGGKKKSLFIQNLWRGERASAI